MSKMTSHSLILVSDANAGRICARVCAHLSKRQLVILYTMQCYKPYFSSVSKKATKSHNRKQERETKFDIFTKLSEPSFQAVWLYNTVLSDVRRFKRCLCNTSTKYK